MGGGSAVQLRRRAQRPCQRAVRRLRGGRGNCPGPPRSGPGQVQPGREPSGPPAVAGVHLRGPRPQGAHVHRCIGSPGHLRLAASPRPGQCRAARARRPGDRREGHLRGHPEPSSRPAGRCARRRTRLRRHAQRPSQRRAGIAEAPGPATEVHLHDPDGAEPHRHGDAGAAPARAAGSGSPPRGRHLRGRLLRRPGLRRRTAADDPLTGFRRRPGRVLRIVLQDARPRTEAGIHRGRLDGDEPAAGTEDRRGVGSTGADHGGRVRRGSF